MRPLTPFGSYLDNAGHPLVGRVRFCNPDASPAEVFAEDGTTSLGRSVFTDSSGRPVQQPFLEDHDYLLFFDKYVGHATMTEDDDTDSWEEQGSAIDRYDVFGVSVECGTVVSVSNIAVLRETAPNTVTPFDGVYMVDLLGYDEVGDKPVLRYVWDSENTDSDDGGSVIEVDGVETGRWVIKDRPEYVDSRHFGAFPNSTATAYPTQRYNLQRAALWAHGEGLGLYLHADDTHAYYDISGINIYDLKCAPGATVFTITGSTSNIIGLESVTVHSGEDLEGTTVLTDRVVRTSWAGTSSHTRLSPTERLVIDSQFYGIPGFRSWENVDVDIYDNSNGDLHFEKCAVYVHVAMDSSKTAYFDACTFVAAGTMDGNLHFDNCFIPANVFVHNFDATNCTVTGCSVAPADEWEDVKDWLALKIDNGDWEYDFCGRGPVEVLIGKPEGSTGTLVLKNGKSIVLKASGTIPKVDLLDCVNTIISTIPQDSKLYVSGGSVGGSVTLHDEVYFGNATVDGSFSVYSSVGADDCIFTPTSSVYASYIRLSNCRADAGSTFSELGTSFGFEGSVYDNCTISGEVSGYKSTVRNSHVAKLTVVGLVAGSVSSPWESVIENSRVDDCRLQVNSSNKPAFSWRNSSIAITQFAARYDVSTSSYTREWTCENCEVTFGTMKFRRRITEFRPVMAGVLKPVIVEDDPDYPYICLVVDDLLLFENLHLYRSYTQGQPPLDQYFSFMSRGCTCVGTAGTSADNETRFGQRRIVNVDGVPCVVVGMYDYSIDPGDTVYVDVEIDF